MDTHTLYIICLMTLPKIILTFPDAVPNHTNQEAALSKG